MNTHVVTKQLPGAKGMLEPGTKVDASKWRHKARLEEQRYLKPLTGQETQLEAQPETVKAEEATPKKRGRKPKK